MVFTLLPASAFAAAATAPAIPAYSSQAAIDAGAVAPALTILDTLGTPQTAATGPASRATPGTLPTPYTPSPLVPPAATPVASPPAPSAPAAQAPAALPDASQAEAQLGQYFVDQGVSPSDLTLPVIDFLAKYPQFRSDVSAATGIRALNRAVYDFTPFERRMLEQSIAFSFYHTDEKGHFYSYAELMAASGQKAPMALGSVLVIDDDGSENNNGPGMNNAATFIPFLNWTGNLTLSLSNISVTYDVFVSPYGSGEFPDFMTLTSYDKVIYVTGDNFNACGAVCIRRSSAYLDAEGDMWFLGTFVPYVYDGALETDNVTTPPVSTFLTDYLGVKSYASFGTANPMNGTSYSFLANQSYVMNRWFLDNSTGLGLPSEYGFSMNYSGGVSEAVTIGRSLNWHGEVQNNVVNNILTHPASKGYALISAFEFSYMMNGPARDDFVNRTMVRLNAAAGLTYDADTDISVTDLEVFSTARGYGGWGMFLWDTTQATPDAGFIGYIQQVSTAIERGTPTTFNISIENFRNVAFNNADPKIELTGSGDSGWTFSSTGTPLGTVNPTTRIENSTRIQNVNIPARALINVSMAFTPHRMFIQRPHALATTTVVDAQTGNNELFGGFLLVVGFYEGAEDNHNNIVVDNGGGPVGWVKTCDATKTITGTCFWETQNSAVQAVDSSLILPWMDMRGLNGSQASRWGWDFAALAWAYWGDSGADQMSVEYRTAVGGAWQVARLVSGDTDVDNDAVLDWRWPDSDGTTTGPGSAAGAGVGWLGVTIPQSDFVQMKFRWTSARNSGSVGYRVDQIASVAYTEQNQAVDFVPTPMPNAIAPPSPTYTVRNSGGTIIATGSPLTGTVVINETETVTIHTGMLDPQGDSFSYYWTQTPFGYSAAMPVNQTLPVYGANVTWVFATDLGTYEALTGGTGSNLYLVGVRATDELSRSSWMNWSIRVRDAPPVYLGDTSFTLDEDSVLCQPAQGPDAWFIDQEGDAVTIVGSSPLVNGSQTVTLSDQRAINGSICLVASSADWHGITNLTITGTDSKGSSQVTLIPVTIRAVNDAPKVSLAELAQLNLTLGMQGRFISVNVTLFDVDNTQASLVTTVDTNPAGKWTEQRNATGNIQLLAVFPDNSMVGFNWFNVTICDASLACSVATFHVWIENTNDAPQILTLGDPRSVNQGEQFSLQIDVTDPDDIATWLPPTVFTFWDDTTLFEIQPNGMITFTPGNNEVGAQLVHVFVSDNGNPQLNDDLQFTITVVNVNDPPVLPPYSDINVTQDQVFTAPPIKANDPDLALFDRLPPDQQEALIYTDDCPLFNIQRIDQVNVQTGQPEPAGQIRITATNEQVGDWDCTVTVTDRAGAANSRSIHIRVNNVNDAPTGVKVNWTNQGSGATGTVTIDNGKVTIMEDDPVLLQVIVDDPDLHMRVNDAGVPVDPTETLTCSILVTHVPGGEVPPSGPVEKPTIDPSQCISDFTPGNDEVGTFSITFTVRDSQQISVTFRIKLEVLNKNTVCLNPRVLTPTASFNLESKQTLSLSGSCQDPDTPESLLTFAWRIEVTGGKTYTASGKTTSVAIENTATDDRAVSITLTITDNLDPAVPLETSATAQGTIKAAAGAGGGAFDITTIGLLVAVIAAAAVGVLLMRKRKPKTPETAPAPAAAAGPAQPQYDYSQQGDQQYDYSQQGDQQYDYSQQQYDPNTQVYDDQQQQQ